MKGVHGNLSGKVRSRCYPLAFMCMHATAMSKRLCFLFLSLLFLVAMFVSHGFATLKED